MLNSLAEEKLQSSLRLLAQHGCFLEIGKFDLSNNTGLGTYTISRYKHIGHVRIFLTVGEFYFWSHCLAKT